MELSVADAARQLGVDESRVRKLLRDRDLAGRRLAGRWLVDSGDVTRLAGFVPKNGPRAGGRPLSPPRAWGLLDLLDGGNAPWLAPVARSQVRSLLRRLSGSDANRWRAALRARSDIHRAGAHPAAVARLANEPDALIAGPAAAAARGLDIVVLQSLPEVYVRPKAWPLMVKRYGLQMDARNPVLVVRIPRAGWWPAEDGLSPAVLAADLLDDAEPRAVSAAAGLLNSLAANASAPR